MKLLVLTEQGQITQQARFGERFELQTSADLSLKTKEGDWITLSWDDQFGLSKTRQETQFTDGGRELNFSLVGKAASEFALQIGGDLNKEELAAIRDFTNALVPLAQGFFNENGLDLKRTQEVFSDKSGVIQEVELSLGKTIQTTVSAYNLSDKLSENFETLENGFEEFELPKAIRNMNKLIQSVINSVFRPLQAELPDDSLIQTLSEFKSFLADQVKELTKLAETKEPIIKA